MNLFKKLQNSLEKRVSTKKYDESVLHQSNLWMQSITWGLITTTGFAFTWLALAKTEEIVVAPGKLEPIGAVKIIKMPIGGIAQEILVKDGDQVKEGQILIKLDSDLSNRKSVSLEENLRLGNIQLNLKQVEISRYKTLNRDMIKTLNEKISFEKEILERFKSLAKSGASSELQYLQQRSTVKQVEGELRETILDGKRYEAKLGQELQQIKTELNITDSELQAIKVGQRFEVLRSPVSGIVFDLKPTNPGYSARVTDTLLKIVPLNALEAKVEIPSSDIGFVRVGMSADISIDSFPSTDFGIVIGEVVHVGSDALSPDPAKQKIEYRFPAAIKLSTQSLNLKSGHQLGLQPGMSLTANIKLRKVTYLQLLLGSFQDKVDSLRQI